MRKTVKLLSLFLSLIIIFLCCGCDGVYEKAYIYFELSQKPATLDPQVVSTDSEMLISKNIYEGLLRKNSDGEIVCGVAESYKKDGLTYTFNIRDGSVWSNGDKVTADDFVFAFQRALSVKTKATFAYELFCIKNAKKINTGELSEDKLGVTAKDDKTLVIKLEYENPNFEEILTSPIAMPCNRKFFNNSTGKYGLTSEYILSNGSYRLTKWNKDDFGIRLYKNEEYNGDFKAKNAAVFLTCDTSEESVIDKLNKNSIDCAIINSSDKNAAEKAGFLTVSKENTCWFLVISDDIPYDMRKAFVSLVNTDSINETIYKNVNSIYPSDIISQPVAKYSHSDNYNIALSKESFKNSLTEFENGVFPSSVTLVYEDKEDIKSILSSLLGHWQKNLGAYINITPAKNPDELISQLKEQTTAFSFFSVTSKSGTAREYLRYFSDEHFSDNLDEAQENILSDYKIIPIMYEDTVIAYNEYLTEMFIDSGNGYIDFSFIVKKE